MASMDELKKAAGVRAADMIKDGMIVGLGTGSTAAHMVNRLAERIKTEGIHVTGVSTSWSQDRRHPRDGRFDQLEHHTPMP